MFCLSVIVIQGKFSEVLGYGGAARAKEGGGGEEVV